ncbi:hypothetical protein [Rhodococcus sp. B10]|uniref:hypothetical protein n=1 Tax=Rhodococcus sp. B10 TaxID=2695876 RepID=UPI001430191F|nr:hypothetical protein [Rhodococcus sp. B10]NIL77608.1 hypothetical protein [Rhodococcus sp. B10]
MAYPLISEGDLQTFRSEVFSEAQLPQVLFLIRFASAVARQEVPTLDASVESAALDIDLVKGVICVMVSRALDNMRIGPNIKSEQFPEVTTEYNFSSADFEELVYMTDKQKARLTPPVTTSKSFSIAPG